MDMGVSYIHESNILLQYQFRKFYKEILLDDIKIYEFRVYLIFFVNELDIV